MPEAVAFPADELMPRPGRAVGDGERRVSARGSLARSRKPRPRVGAPGAVERRLGAAGCSGSAPVSVESALLTAKTTWSEYQCANKNHQPRDRGSSDRFQSSANRHALALDAPRSRVPPLTPPDAPCGSEPENQLNLRAHAGQCASERRRLGLALPDRRSRTRTGRRRPADHQRSRRNTRRIWVVRRHPPYR